MSLNKIKKEQEKLYSLDFKMRKTEDNIKSILKKYYIEDIYDEYPFEIVVHPDDWVVVDNHMWNSERLSEILNIIERKWWFTRDDLLNWVY